MATQDIAGFSNVGSKCLVLHGQVTGITSAGASTLSFPSISVDATWIAPQAGALFAISGAQKAATGTPTLVIAACINGVATALTTPALAFNGAVQTFYVVANSTIAFAAGDKLTLSATPSAAITLGYASIADLMIII